jgi:hypothetical protein
MDEKYKYKNKKNFMQVWEDNSRHQPMPLETLETIRPTLIKIPEQDSDDISPSVPSR